MNVISIEMCCSYWCLCDDNLMLKLCLETNTYQSLFLKILISCWFSKSYKYSEALCKHDIILYSLQFLALVWVLAQFILYRSVFCYAKHIIETLSNKHKSTQRVSSFSFPVDIICRDFNSFLCHLWISSWTRSVQWPFLWCGVSGHYSGQLFKKHFLEFARVFDGKVAHQSLQCTLVHHPMHCNKVISHWVLIFFPSPNHDGQWPVRHAKVLRNIHPFLLS